MTGNFTNDQSAIVTYKKQEVPKISIAVHYQDDDSKNIAGLDDKNLTGKAGDNYTINTPAVDGYAYEKCSLPLTGKFTDNQSAVVTYKKQEAPKNPENPSDNSNPAPNK